MRLIAGVLAVALLLPAGADAQRRPRYNQFSFSPYVGVYKDAYDFEADGSDVGFLVGFKAGFQEGSRTNLHLNLGYAQANDVATRVPLAPVVDNQWVLLTAGGDFALVPGATAVAISADLGVGWRRNTYDDISGADRSDGWGAYAVAAPGLVLRHTFSQRTALWLQVQDYIFDVLEASEHSPALTLGLSFR